MFGNERSEFVEYLQGNNVAMKNLLFKDWDAGHEGFPYPPQMGPYAVYTIDDLHEHIDFAVQKVLSNIKLKSVNIVYKKTKNKSYDQNMSDHL
jgi:hypothetical protein